MSAARMTETDLIAECPRLGKLNGDQADALKAWQTAHSQAMQHAADLKRTLAWALQRIDEGNRGEYWDRARALVDDGTPTVPPSLLPAARAALALLEDPDADEFQANKVTAQLRAALGITP